MTSQSQNVDWSIPVDTISDADDTQLVRACTAPGCNAINPPEALFCHVDGKPLKPGQTVDPFAALRSACRGTRLDWTMVSYLAQEAQEAGHSLPPDLTRFEEEAKRRLGCLAMLSYALEQNDLQGVVDYYNPALIDDWPDCVQLGVRSRQAMETLANLKQLQTLLANPGDGLALLALWSRVEPELSRWPDAVESVRPAVLQLQTRNLAWDNLKRLCQSSPSERAIAEAWHTLQQCEGHPDAAKVQARVDLAARRIACLDKLPSPSHLPSEELDSRIVKTWSDTLLKGCAEAQPLRPLFDDATRRLAILAELDRVVSQVDAGVLPESVILQKAELPSGYLHRHQGRVATARTRRDLLASWEIALGRDKQSDRELASAWTKAEKAKVRFDPAAQKRGSLAVRRSDRLGEIEAMDRSLPLDEQDRLWLKFWDETLFEGCGDADPHRKRYDDALLRLKAWRNLKKAMKERDFTQLLLLTAKPLLKDYPPRLKVEEELKALLEVAKRLKKSRDLLARNDFNAFVNQLDLEFLRMNSDLFSAEREAIEVAVKLWLEEKPRIASADPASKNDPYSGLLVVRWTWQHFQLVSRCEVALSPTKFLKTPAEAADGTMRWDAEAHRRAGGGVLVPPIGKSRVYVTVWPVVDLGWKELFGPPLHIGPCRTPSPRKF